MSTLFASTTRRVVAAASVTALVILGAFAGSFAYFRAHALPRTQVGAVDISGLTPSDAVTAVASGFGDPEITVSAPGGDITVPLSETGVVLDAEETVDHIFSDSASVGSFLGGLVSGNSYSPQVHINDKTFTKFAAELPLADTAEPADAQIAFDGNSFAVTPSRSGEAIDEESLQQALVDAAKTGATAVTASTIHAEPSISTEVAQAAADQANTWLATPITVNDGDQMETTPDAATKSSWITFASDAERLTPAVDRDAVKSWVEDYAKTTNIEPGQGIRNLDASGNVVATVIEPTKGWVVSNADVVTDAIVGGLPLKEAITATFDYKEQAGEWTERQADPATEGMRYRAAPGEKWVEIDIGGATVTAYEGAKPVYTFPVVAGKASTPTIEGEYNVYLQYEKQDMGCTPEWSYCAKDVPWVSYFTGSYALHGSSSWQSGFGDPATRHVQGSAGCVNMRDEDANTLFHWVDIGTKVISHS